MDLSSNQIRLSLQNALLGEIYPELRAIAYSYNSRTSDILLRYYLEREPIEDDYDSLNTVMGLFIGDFKFSEFNKILEECEYNELPINQIDSLDGFVYLRKE